MSRFRRLTIAVAAALLLAAPASAQNIKIGLTLPKDVQGFDFINGLYELFKTEVEKTTALKVEIVYGGALGPANDRMNQMRRNIIQMSDVAEGNLATIYPDIQVLSLPYLFASEAAAAKVLDGAFGQAMAEDIRKKTGIRVFGFWESGGFKHYSANKPIRSAADFPGLKMRALGPAFAKPVEALGGSASPIAFNELYTSLKTGVVDGQDNATAVFVVVKLYEVQKYLILSGHIYGIGLLALNDDFYGKLPAKDQQAVAAAAAKALAFNRPASRRAEAAALAFVKSQGVQVIELSTAVKADLAKRTQGPVIDWLKTQVSSPKLIDDALAAARQAGN